MRGLRYTGHKDREGRKVFVGDTIREGFPGEMIWGGKGEIMTCPEGVIVSKNYITQTVVGKVKMSDGKNSDLYCSTYDGVFQWSKNIEVLPDVYGRLRKV